MWYLLTRILLRYKYTDADKKLYEQIKEEIDGDSAPNASRWYNHIKNILSDPALKSYYTQNSSSEDNEDDEDDDLFGEDDEEEVEKMKQERAKEAEAKKKGSSSGKCPNSRILCSALQG